MISMTAFAVQAPSAYSNAYLRNTTCGTLGIGLSKSNFARWPSNGAKRTALPSVSFNGDGRVSIHANLFTLGVPAEVVQTILLHANVSTTRTHYIVLEF